MKTFFRKTIVASLFLTALATYSCEDQDAEDLKIEQNLDQAAPTTGTGGTGEGGDAGSGSNGGSCPDC